MCVHLCNCKLHGLVVMVSLDFKTSWKMFTHRGEVCNEVNLCHFCMGLDLAFGRTEQKNRENKAKLWDS